MLLAWRGFFFYPSSVSFADTCLPADPSKERFLPIFMGFIVILHNNSP